MATAGLGTIKFELVKFDGNPIYADEFIMGIKKIASLLEVTLKSYFAILDIKMELFVK